MTVRQVHLHEGPCAGRPSIASHQTAVCDGEVYVWDGSDDEDSFIHARTAMEKLPQREVECERVRIWMDSPGTPSGVKDRKGRDLMLPPPMAMLIGIPPWRINAWLQLLRYGQASFPSGKTSNKS